MPGVPSDAFAQVKKGLKSMFRKRTQARQDQKHSQSTATSSEVGQTAPPNTTPAAPVPAAAPAEMSSNEPVKIPMVECARGQEATSGAVPTEGPTSTTNTTQPTNTPTTTAAAPTPPNPEFVVTPPAGESSTTLPQTPDRDIKPGKYDTSSTDAVAATTGTTPAPTNPPTPSISDHEPSTSTPKLESERPASPAPKMSATSGPLDDHPNFA